MDHPVDRQVSDYLDLDDYMLKFSRTSKNKMIKIIIKLSEFFLNPGLIPPQRDQMSQKII